jgi:hypothetical protein
MGTRSTIAVKHGDRIKAVYCHWDGYVEHNGKILLENYDSTKANFLVALGDISSLRKELGEKHPFSKFECKEGEYDEAKYENWTTFYGRDRGEDGTEWKSFGSEAEWMDYYDGSGAEYYYVMDNGVWYVSAYRDEFKPLHEEVAKLNKEEA